MSTYNPADHEHVKDLPTGRDIKKTFAFNPTTDIPPLDGKVILITGANSGIGLQTALELAKHDPAQIWLTTRTAEKGRAGIARIKAQSPKVHASFLELELNSLDSVKAAARTFLASSERLDLLYLNAGILGHPADVTADGYEIHMGVNHVGHAALLRLLTPRLLETASSAPHTDVRVVSLASIGYKSGKAKDGISFDILKQAGGAVPIERYIQSKLANLLYAQEFATRHPEFKTIPIHPGEVDTNLFTREPGDETIRYLQTEVVPKHITTVEEGVKNTLWASTSHSVETGHYYEPVGVADMAVGWAQDEALRTKLWNWTEAELDTHNVRCGETSLAVKSDSLSAFRRPPKIPEPGRTFS